MKCKRPNSQLEFLNDFLSSKPVSYLFDDFGLLTKIFNFQRRFSTFAAYLDRV